MWLLYEIFPRKELCARWDEFVPKRDFFQIFMLLEGRNAASSFKQQHDFAAVTTRENKCLYGR